MAENTGIDETHDDDLGDEALDRSVGGKFICYGTVRSAR